MPPFDLLNLTPEDKSNLHLVGCLDPNADKDWRTVVYARFPYNGTYIAFLCSNCKRRHLYVMDPKLRNWKDNS